MKHIIRTTAIFLAMILTFSVTGCGQKTTLTGTWTSEDNSKVYVFNEDGTGTVQLSSGISLSISYTKTDSSITISMTYLGQTEDDEYTYTLKDNQLSLTRNGQTVNYEKQ